jgi:serine/threonine protein kinase
VQTICFCWQGIAHRDVKPENLVMTEDLDLHGPLVKLADFGFASIYEGE